MIKIIKFDENADFNEDFLKFILKKIFYNCIFVAPSPKKIIQLF